MIKVAANPPNVNAMSIVTRGLDELGFRGGADPLGAFGISIGTEMAIVPGRILSPPGIRYGRGTPLVDDRASWNLRGVKFAQGGRLTNWLVLVIKEQRDNSRFPNEFESTQDPELLATVDGFVGMARTCGMEIDPRSPPVYVEVVLPAKDPSDPVRRKAVNEIRIKITSTPKKPIFVLVLLSSTDKHIYNGIKHLCDSYLDIHTVCVQQAKIRKPAGMSCIYILNPMHR